MVVSAMTASSTFHRMTNTRLSSITVGKIANRLKRSRLSIARVPRSIESDSLPVCRPRWKRIESAWRWRNTSSATVRIARCATLMKMASRASLNARERIRAAP